MMIPEFRLVDVSWLARVKLMPWLPELVSGIGSAMTVGYEIAFVFLVWNRLLRPIVIGGGVIMHAGIGLFMGLGSFGAAMLSGLMAFVSPTLLRQTADAVLRGPSGYRVVLDRRDRRQLELMSFIRGVDPWRQVELVDASASPVPSCGMTLILPDGAALTGAAAFVRLVRALRTLWVWWPLVAWKAVRAANRRTPATGPSPV